MKRILSKITSTSPKVPCFLKCCCLKFEYFISKRFKTFKISSNLKRIPKVTHRRPMDRKPRLASCSDDNHP